MDGVRVDSRSCYDNTTNFRFTPDVPGKYGVDVVGQLNVASGVICQFRARKNGTDDIVGPQFAAPATGIGSAMSIGTFDMNGTTDYLEIFVAHTDAGPQNLTFCEVRFSYLGK